MTWKGHANMSDLIRYRTALEPFQAQLTDIPAPGLRLIEHREYAFISVRGQLGDPAIREAYARAGLNAPERALSLTQNPNETLLWISPNECLLICPLAQREQWLSRLREALADCFAAVVDTSGTFAYLELRGEQAAQCLAKVCHYDFDEANFPVGKVVSSVIKAIPCHFIRTEQSGIRVLLRFSFAHFLYRLIAHAAAEFQQAGQS